MCRAERQAQREIATLQQEIKQLEDPKQEHRAEAAAALKAYNDANAVARAQYQARIEGDSLVSGYGVNAGACGA